MKNESNEPSLAYRPPEAAKALGISRRLLWQLTKDGEIACVRIGNGKRQLVRYPRSVIQEYLLRKTIMRKKAEGGPTK